MTRQIYDDYFYNSQSAASSRSAYAVTPIIIDMVRPRSVVDIGCGVGTWLKVFCENGVSDVLGIDGAYVDRNRLQIPPDYFMSSDLTSSMPLLNRNFDLALCLEVAEHIPENRASNLIDFITTLAPVVCFSAAVPGQGGAGHLNEQWPSYWCRLFAERGYQCLDVLRPKIWDIASVEPWYCQNTFLFVNETNIKYYPEFLNNNLFSATLPKSVIHPELFKRFASLEYVQSRQLLCALLERVKKKLSGSHR